MLYGCAHNGDIVRVNPKDDAGSIREALLTHTPIGAKSDDVLNFINKNLSHKNRSPVKYNVRQGIYSNEQKQLIGTRSITILLGEYGRNLSNLFLIKTGIFVKWAFNENNSLLNVIVVKENDGP